MTKNVRLLHDCEDVDLMCSLEKFNFLYNYSFFVYLSMGSPTNRTQKNHENAYSFGNENLSLSDNVRTYSIHS